MRNLFVIGPDDHNMSRLTPLADSLDCQFRGILHHEDLQLERRFPFRENLERAIEQLDAFDGSIDGIMGYWDFPVTTMLPVLRDRYGCPGASLLSVLRCEHKYYSRLLQQQIAPEHVPAFRAIDPFDDEVVARLEREPGYPFWIKPIKAHSSQLGFRVCSRDDLVQAISQIRRRIAGFGGPFDQALELAQDDLPEEVKQVRGGWCLVEGLIGGHQCTLEGYVHRGEVTIPTIVDSIRVGGSSSFARYQYPSRLPASVQDRMQDLTSRVMKHIEYDEATFNIELYWEEKEDRLSILEINPRASQSHTVITEMVDGLPHLEAMAALALGRKPAPHPHTGRYPLAAKLFIRATQDARVRRTPSAEEVARIEKELDCQVQVKAKRGERLSDLINQDSYSFELAVVHMGARDEEELEAKYDKCKQRLGFDLSGDAEVRAHV